MEKQVGTSPLDTWMLNGGMQLIGAVTLGGFGLWVIVLCIWSIQEGLQGLRIARESSQWPTVPGRVVLSKEDVMVKGDTGAKTFAPWIEYTYLVDGKEYKSFRVRSTSFDYLLNTEWSKPWLDAYPVGKEVVVYVNPANPSESVLLPGEGISVPSCRRKIVNSSFGLLGGLATVGYTLLYIWPGWLVKSA